MAQGLNTMNQLKTCLEPYGETRTFDDHFEVRYLTGVTVGVQCDFKGQCKLVFDLEDLKPLRAGTFGPGLNQRMRVTFPKLHSSSGEMYTEAIRMMAGRHHSGIWDAGNNATEEVIDKAESLVWAVFLASI